MPRSVGITISAIVVFAGSAFTLLGGAMLVVGSALLSRSSPATNLPMNSGVFLAADAVLSFGFGGWGLASGIGLLYLKSWARISTLVFAGFLVCISLPAAALILLIPLPNSHDPSLPFNFMSVTRMAMALFYGVFAVLGGCWLYFFNKRSVKMRFEERPSTLESAAGDLFSAAQIPAPAVSQGARPLSTTIIGWFLLITAALAPLGLLFNRAFFPGTQLPLYFFGFFFFWMGCLFGFQHLDGCPDRCGGGTAEAEELGPVCDHWLARLGRRECRTADAYPRTPCKVSTGHGNDDSVHERAPAATGAICVSRMDRVGHGFACDAGDLVVPHYAEASILVCCRGVGAAVLTA